MQKAECKGAKYGRYAHVAIMTPIPAFVNEAWQVNISGSSLYNLTIFMFLLMLELRELEKYKPKNCEFWEDYAVKEVFGDYSVVRDGIFVE